MDNSKEWEEMITSAIILCPVEFEGFDKTKNLQDQIQEMMFNEQNSLEENHDEFIHWLWGGTMSYNYYPSEYSRFSSMEQLWLAFYMYEKHKKTWDKEKWVKYED